MADNYLERHYEEYERRKTEWQRKRAASIRPCHVEKPDDEAL